MGHFNEARFLSLVMIASAALAHGQASYSPSAPLNPTTMAQCERFQANYDKFVERLATQHQNCLDSHAKSSPARKGVKGGKGAAPEPAETCSVPACQSLHTRWQSATSTGASEANSCRQRVQSAKDDQAREKEAEELAKRNREAEEKERKDNLARKKYSDDLERTQAARDTAARKKAAEDEAAAKKHDELMEKQKKQRDDAAAQERKERDARDRRLNLDGYAEKHAAWKARDDQRKARMEQLEDAAANIPDEQQRHAALEAAVKEIQQIRAQRKQDPEPK